MVAVSQLRFSMASILALSSKTTQSWASTDVVGRNRIILAFSIGVPSRVDSGSWKSTDDFLLKSIPPAPIVPGNPPAETTQERMRHPCRDDDCVMVDSSR